ncbi:preprotein translocase subunit Sec61beta [Candidatus Micrarchaeota archaeon]|nr:preprotein translocase subunit Sec61beta [Candidatus Micrarchaeota archaeon]
MADHRVATPSSSTGIIRFYDVKSSNVQIDPRIVIGFVAAFIVLELAIQVVF